MSFGTHILGEPLAHLGGGWAAMSRVGRSSTCAGESGHQQSSRLVTEGFSRFYQHCRDRGTGALRLDINTRFSVDRIIVHTLVHETCTSACAHNAHGARSSPREARTSQNQFCTSVSAKLKTCVQDNAQSSTCCKSSSRRVVPGRLRAKERGMRWDFWVTGG